MAPRTLNEIANDAPLTGFRIADRWGIVAEVGYQAVPDVLILHQGQLELGSDELNVLLNLTAHWWRRGDFVFPGTATIANRMGVSERTVQRLVRSLVTKGFVRRARADNGGIFYDLAPLHEKLKPLAVKVLQQRDELRQLASSAKKAPGDG